MKLNIGAATERARMQRKIKRTLDTRHKESLRRLAARDKNFNDKPRSAWTRYDWKKYNDMIAERLG